MDSGIPIAAVFDQSFRICPAALHRVQYPQFPDAKLVLLFQTILLTGGVCRILKSFL